MNLHLLARAGFLGIAFIALGAAPATAENDEVPFSTNLSLDNSHVLPDTGDSVVRAFVLTRSSSRNCLVTLGESNAATAGISVFCGVRAPTSFGGKTGIMITVLFPGPVPDPLILTANLHQDGAKMYGKAVPCLPEDNC